MAINDTTALGPPTGRSGARHLRSLSGRADSPALALRRPADVDATPSHHGVAESAAPASADDAGPVPHGAAAAPAPHRALLTVLKAPDAVAEDSSSPRVLQKVAEAAREATGARYAALTLVRPGVTSGTRVESGEREEPFSGVPRSRTDPTGLADQRPALGWPSGRSRHRSLTVPVTARGSVLGHLHVSGPAAGQFSADDEDRLAAVAVTAGIAVENIRSSAERRRVKAIVKPRGNSSTHRLRVVRDDERAPSHPSLSSRVVRRLSALSVALRAEDPGPRRDRR